MLNEKLRIVLELEEEVAVIRQTRAATANSMLGYRKPVDISHRFPITAQHWERKKDSLVKDSQPLELLSPIPIPKKVSGANGRLYKAAVPHKEMPPIKRHIEDPVDPRDANKRLHDTSCERTRRVHAENTRKYMGIIRKQKMVKGEMWESINRLYTNEIEVRRKHVESALANADGTVKKPPSSKCKSSPRKKAV